MLKFSWTFLRNPSYLLLILLFYPGSFPGIFTETQGKFLFFHGLKCNRKFKILKIYNHEISWKFDGKNNELQINLKKNFHEIPSGTSRYIHGIFLDPELPKLLVGTFFSGTVFFIYLWMFSRQLTGSNTWVTSI